jgi:hypothetical protein
MKRLSFLSAIFFITLSSFTLLKINGISAYINGKAIPENTVLKYEQNGTEMTIRAQIPTGARFNELTFTLPNTAVGSYPISKDSKAKIMYVTSHGTGFNSQSQDNSKGYIKVVSNTTNGLQIEFECNIANQGQKFALKTGKMLLKLQ